MEIVRCPLTSKPIRLVQDGSSSAYRYDTPTTGKVWITHMAFSQASTLSPEEKNLLCGICRNKTIANEEPVMITTQFLSTLQSQKIPHTFQEKAKHFLKYLYDNGGKEFKTTDIDSSDDSPIAYASSDELDRVINLLKMKNWVAFEEKLFGAACSYRGLVLTTDGIDEMEKGLPKMPMISLVNQEITTGDAAVDSKIKQAKTLFFNEPSSLDNKRSACEALSFVLEPLRDNLKEMFENDTESLFNIVNNFNIRHNKHHTKRIVHEEMLEWIFYSLLNTINTYVKMKRKATK